MSNVKDHAPPASAKRARRLAPRIAGLLGTLVAATAAAQVPMKAITGGLESGTTLVTLPGTPSGTLAARECSSGCPTMRLKFDRNTKFFIGDYAVSYSKFREAASRGDLRLMISYRLSDNTLTRLRLPAAAKQ